MGSGLWLALVAMHLLFTFLDSAYNSGRITFDDWSVINGIYSAYGLDTQQGGLGAMFLQARFYYEFLTQLAFWNYVIFSSQVGTVFQAILVILTVALVARTFSLRPAGTLALGAAGLVGAFLT